MAKFSIARLMAEARYDQITKKYGKDSDTIRAVGTATMIGSDLAEGFSKYSRAKAEQEAVARKQEEIDARADISVANILTKGKKVQAVQATSFIKAGVKLEGSAIDVLNETAQSALDAASIRRREADFAIGQLEVEKAVARAKAKMAPWETLANVGMSAAIGFGGK